MIEAVPDTGGRFLIGHDELIYTTLNSSPRRATRSATASFAYDAFGRRTSKTVGGTTTGLLYDGANVVQELSGGTPAANLLTGGVDQVFTRTDASGTRTLLPDGLGSTLALVDGAGVVQTQYTYEPFGATTVTGQASANPTQYTGREHDGTGLSFYRARYYHPQLQRGCGGFV